MNPSNLLVCFSLTFLIDLFVTFNYTFNEKTLFFKHFSIPKYCCNSFSILYNPSCCLVFPFQFCSTLSNLLSKLVLYETQCSPAQHLLIITNDSSQKRILYFESNLIIEEILKLQII